MGAENLQCLCVMCVDPNHMYKISVTSWCWIVAFLVLMLSLNAESFEDGSVVRVICRVLLRETRSAVCSSFISL